MGQFVSAQFPDSRAVAVPLEDGGQRRYGLVVEWEEFEYLPVVSLGLFRVLQFLFGQPGAAHVDFRTPLFFVCGLGDAVQGIEHGVLALQVRVDRHHQFQGGHVAGIVVPVVLQ